MSDENEIERGEDGEPLRDYDVSISLPEMLWVEVAAALKVYINTIKGAPASRRDALQALRIIDAKMMGTDSLAPPDDLLGLGGDDS